MDDPCDPHPYDFQFATSTTFGRDSSDTFEFGAVQKSAIPSGSCCILISENAETHVPFLATIGFWGYGVSSPRPSGVDRADKYHHRGPLRDVGNFSSGEEHEAQVVFFREMGEISFLGSFRRMWSDLFAHGDVDSENAQGLMREQSE